MIRALLPVCLAAIAAPACGGQPEAVVLHIALRSGVSTAAAGDLLAGDTVAVVRLDPAAPATIASTPAGQLIVPFTAALNETARPATSPAVTMPLPDPPPAGLEGVALEVMFFTDLNHDAAWQRGEPYATAWSGGRGGYRVTLDTSSPPAGPGWRLLEGGEPPTVHPNPVDLVVYIDPVRPAVER